MRIIALPLTRAAILPKNHAPTNAGGISGPALTFYHFQLRSPPGAGLTDAENEKKQGRIKSLVTWVSTKAADAWAGFGRAPEGNWKV
jgi:Mitochondrial K+-H+ exchange-related